ncbi:MAG: transglycosylase SLT domain-containing protein [Gammaproteobacteria bacterium]|nr:transglycosylase SLT domain-containing protein [Gammaproteobacteria bacterium]
MARRHPVTPPNAKPRKPRKRRARISRFQRSAHFVKNGYTRLRSAPGAIQVVLGLVIVVTLAIATNWLYQVVRKPSELFFPVSGVLFKTPPETWREYAPIFRAHATAVMTPELLAALAQVEASGNPVARTYWRWSFSLEPFKVYRPASSAVGMYQITDGTFAEARRYCIHDHRVAEMGRWYELRTCWFNDLYMRVVPSHAVEMTAANLDRQVTKLLTRRDIGTATVQQKQDLAIVIHLCGAGAGASYAGRGFQFRPDQRCGDHDPRAYLARVHAFERVFARLNASDDESFL